MTDSSASTAQSGLDKLRAKYGGQTIPHIAQVYDRSQQTTGRLEQRLGSAPRIAGGTATGNYLATLGGIKLELAQLADDYGKFNTSFMDALRGKDKYTIGERLRLGWHKYATGNRQKVLTIKTSALQRRGDALEYLVTQMGKVLNDQHQKAIEGRDKAKTLQIEVVGHMKTLDRKLIDSLKGGNYKGADLTDAQAEAGKLEQDLLEVNEMLEGYQMKIRQAQDAGKLEDVRKLTEEAGQILDIKYNILDGRIAADGIVSEIRRSILDSAEAVQSSKGALAASSVNYQATNALIDSFNELEIKYRHAISDFLPVFLIQGKIADLGESGLTMRQALLKSAELSQRLMDVNAKLVVDVAEKSFQLLQTPLYDPAKAKVIEDEITARMHELNKIKIEWAQATRDVGMVTPEAQHHLIQNR
ncbi:MAG: hypothetical protein Q7R96_06080 [Nanoarchaeota archaeon]|nr:hypothetical protein [Nanoarchaeota archaeon]